MGGKGRDREREDDAVVCTIYKYSGRIVGCTHVLSDVVFEKFYFLFEYLVPLFMSDHKNLVSVVP